MGPMPVADCDSLLQASSLYSKYKETLDPESAYEILTKRVNEKMQADEEARKKEEELKLEKQEQRPGRAEKSTMEKVMNAPITRQIGTAIVRGLFGMLTGKKPRSRSGSLFGF
jgi:hypothetical protein